MRKIDPSEITPEHIFLSRRKLMAAAGVTAGAAVLAGCALPGLGVSAPSDPGASAAAAEALESAAGPLPAALAFDEPTAGAAADELGDSLNSFEQITNYNNYYEFTFDKEDVAKLAAGFTTHPWSVEVTGLVNKPRTFTIEELITLFPQQERIYRLRCVEAWSMVIPWVGFPMHELLKAVEPTAEAKFLHFTSVLRPEEMPGQQSRTLDWPYTEGLRLDEAMHDLALFATGMYGKLLTPQQGAPIRVVVPWKYGFKSIKAITKIELTDVQPVSTWEQAAPNEYGFYANVNPQVDHPRWSQSTERRIGEVGRRKTLMFNGYEDEVASLYAGMDLRANY